ncbi:hypothetical protein ABZ023_33020 [Streptomyces sp. NPDC006367]|uniref:hypothetical protein n=1 Tax=unclassified Streptomyces TaxID=2593676 RepID=UPI0033BCD5BD
MCARCGTKFTDNRRQSVRQTSWRGVRDELCGPCWKEDVDRAEAERVVRRQSEEAAAREAAQSETEHRAVDAARGEVLAMLTERSSIFAQAEQWAAWRWDPAWPTPRLPRLVPATRR